MQYGNMGINNVNPQQQATVDYNSPSIVLETDMQLGDPNFPLGLIKCTPELQKELSDRIFYYEGPDYIKHQKDCEANRDYYFNKQWSGEETQKNFDKNQDSLTLNRVRKALNTMAGMFTANKPRYTAMPAGVEDASMAEVANKLLDYIWQKSSGMDIIRNVCLQGLRDNVGYFIVTTNINGDVIFDYADYKEVLIDPKSRDHLFRDAEWIYLKKWIPISTIKEVYGINVLSTSKPEVWTNRYSGNRTQQNGDLVKVGQLIDDHEMYACVYEGYKQVWVRQVDDSFRQQVRKQTILGYDHVYNQILPSSITDRGIIPFYTEFTGNPYVRGEMFFLKEYQDVYNKSAGVTLQSARLHGNPKVFLWDKTLGSSASEMETNYAKVGSINVLSTEEVSAGGNLADMKPIIVQGQPLPSAWFDFMKLMLMELEYSSISADVTGYKDSTQGEQSIFERREAVMDSMKMAIGHYDNSLKQLGVVCIQYAKAFMNKQKMFKVIDNEGKTQQYFFNLEKGLEPEDEGSVTRWREQERKFGTSDVDIDSKLAKAKSDSDYAKTIKVMYDEIDSLDVDLHIVAGSYSPNWEASQWMALMQMRKNNIHIDDSDVISCAPIQNRGVIAAKSSQNAQLTSQNRALHEQVNFLQQQLADLQNRVVQGTMDMQLEEHQLNLDKIEMDARLKERYAVKSANSGVMQAAQLAKKDIEIVKEREIAKLEVVANAIQSAGKGATTATLAEIMNNPMLLGVQMEGDKPFLSQAAKQLG